MNVDKIVVLKDGEKVEEGTFEELEQKKNGIFRGMWERQQRKEREEDNLESDLNPEMSFDTTRTVEVDADRRHDNEAEEIDQVWHESFDH